MTEVDTGTAPVCYRHPHREANVRCNRCERRICPDCMISANVGFQCPDCAKEGTKVRTVRDIYATPIVTTVLIGINVAVFVPQLAQNAGRLTGSMLRNLALFGPAVDAGEWWRLITSGFLHFDLIHILFNMYWLYLLGRMLEPVLGNARFGVLYGTSLAFAGLGAIVATPLAFTAGASGAVYGLLGAAFVAHRRAGVNPMRSSIGTILIFSIIWTFAVPGISIGGHLGGLVGGAVSAWLLFWGQDNDRKGLGVAASLTVAVGAIGVAVAVAEPFFG